MATQILQNVSLSWVLYRHLHLMIWWLSVVNSTIPCSNYPFKTDSDAVNNWLVESLCAHMFKRWLWGRS